MNINSQHPEYQMTVYGMKAGHLPATAQDIALAEGTTPQPKETYTPSTQGPQHPEYVDYCHYARSLGYQGAC
jgi:hypothetical protein